MAGYFITFEGGEGVGKTTQIKQLVSHFQAEGKDVVLTREPGGTPSAEAIRDLIFSTIYDGKWSPQAETLMMFAARAMHIKDVIKPAIDAGKIVVCDRFIDSTRVYQGALNHVSEDLINQLETHIIGDYAPNLTLILDMPADIAMERVQSRGAENNNDRGNLEFYQNLRDGFLNIAKQDGVRCVVVDANREAGVISKDIQNITSERLS